jgi:hypothetical protein
VNRVAARGEAHSETPLTIRPDEGRHSRPVMPRHHRRHLHMAHGAHLPDLLHRAHWPYRRLPGQATARSRREEPGRFNRTQGQHSQRHRRSDLPSSLHGSGTLGIRRRVPRADTVIDRTRTRGLRRPLDPLRPGGHSRAHLSVTGCAPSAREHPPDRSVRPSRPAPEQVNPRGCLGATAMDDLGSGSTSADGAQVIGPARGRIRTAALIVWESTDRKVRASGQRLGCVPAACPLERAILGACGHQRGFDSRHPLTVKAQARGMIPEPGS